MGMADKIVQRAQAHVEPGEIVQGGFAGQRTIQNRIGEGGYRVVVATDRRFLVFQSGTFSQTVFKHLIEESPRQQRLGEPSGLFYDLVIGTQALKVNFRYFNQLRAIDRAHALGAVAPCRRAWSDMAEPGRMGRAQPVPPRPSALLRELGPVCPQPRRAWIDHGPGTATLEARIDGL